MQSSKSLEVSIIGEFLMNADKKPDKLASNASVLRGSVTFNQSRTNKIQMEWINGQLHDVKDSKRTDR